MPAQTLAPRFNPKAPYGDVFGMPGVAYDQNGTLYNDARIAVSSDGEPIPMEPMKGQPEAAKPAAKTGKGGRTAAKAPVIDEDTPDDEKPLDLEGWVAGTAVYPFQTVKAYLMEKTNETDIPDKETAMDLANQLLADAGAAADEQ